MLEAIENKIEEQIEQLSHSIAILGTYQEENMKISEMLESLFNKKKLFVDQKDNILHLKLKGEKAQLHFKDEPIAVACLLQVMQDNVLIGLDNLDDLNAIQKQKWDCTQVYRGWKDVDELLNSDIPTIPLDENRTVFHLFHISKNISLYDINDVIQSLVASGYDGHLLYNVSISESGENTYAIIYSEE